MLYKGITEEGDFIYFALVTPTKVRYGDMTPITEVSKRLAGIGAFGGQFFPITLVARLVST